MSPLPLLVSCQAVGDLLESVTLATAKRFQLQIEGASPALALAIQEWIDAYLAKKPIPFPFPLPRGKPFQRKVWEALAKVPFGTLLSYQELAALAGSPRGARAAGNACATNQWPLFIPCHRIIPSQSPKRPPHPGGFAFEPSIKSLLIDFEQMDL